MNFMVTTYFLFDLAGNKSFATLTRSRRCALTYSPIEIRSYNQLCEMSIEK